MYKKLLQLTLTTLSLLAILAMVTGFVPPIPSQWRGSFDQHAQPDLKPPTRPLSHITWQVRQEFQSNILIAQQNPLPIASLSPTLAPFTSSLSPYPTPTLAPYPVIGLLLPMSTYLNNDPLDLTGTPIRWQAVSCPPTPDSIARKTQMLWQLKQLKLPSPTLQARAKRYEDLVTKFANKYKLSPALIYAIIYAESSFDPNTISNSMAHGLMQVVPRTAGGEVHTWLGKSGLPTPEELLTPETNIKYGTTYIHILMNSHLKAIKDPLSREYCTIAAYNQGSTALLRTFAPTQEEAFKIINNLTPDQVHAALLAKLTSRQTLAFLNKVLSTKARFLALHE